ncbi:Polyketide synthase enoylreductase [Penicillium concentricum]|uniref:Polyketide synthase enoylreductase n=1 Tax=Penicillium concentricum TaxID=293559 RepID=A0A9W9SRU9_9EURO|nr:Polyketide synthase enoylreductase [Penicillium concentricum]KAJ5383553.1 Polyketide synthase enoylreductase [Penicillium concentricum]
MTPEQPSISRLIAQSSWFIKPVAVARTSPQVTHRRAFRRTDDYAPGKPKLKLVQEALALPLAPSAVLIKVHAVALNYRDANIANGGNPWPAVPIGILGNDAAGEVLAVGDKVKTLAVGHRAGPITDTENISGREVKRSWLAADEDGVMADHIIFDADALCKLPGYLDWVEAATIPCAGVTAWSALKGTGGVSVFALKLVRAAGLRVILTSSSDKKLEQMKMKYSNPPIMTTNYSQTPEWDKEILKLTNDVGVDIIVETGGSSSLIKSIRCTRRGGVVSQVGYLSRQDPNDLRELIPTIIDRRTILRAAQMPLNGLIDKIFPFEQAEEAVEYVWEGKQIGKIVLRI